MEIAKTPKPPYFAVIFASKRTKSESGYSKTADEMLLLAKKQSGFLGFESVKDDIGITISYWSSLEAINNWKENSQTTKWAYRVV